jgi:hypothetical protein
MILKSDGGLEQCNDNGRCDFGKGGQRLSAFDAVFHAVAGAFFWRPTPSALLALG